MEAVKGKNTDISRPINQSFRHTGHGSVFGASWGSPAFIDPAYLGDNGIPGNVELRGNVTIYNFKIVPMLRHIFTMSFTN